MIGGLEQNSINLLKSAAFSLQTTEKQPQTSLESTLKGTWRFNKVRPLEGLLYMVKFYGGIQKILLLCNFLKILMVSDKTIHKVLELIQLCIKTKPTKEIFHLTIYQNYTIALTNYT